MIEKALKLASKPLAKDYMKLKWHLDNLYKIYKEEL